MGTYKVACVDKEGRCAYRDCRCVKYIGISAQGGGVNRYTPVQIYNRITNGDNFYVEGNNGSRVYLIKAERDGTKYVRTEPNDTENDNLLNQNSCLI